MMLKKEEGHDSSLWLPCYHALTQGWDVSSFHQQCDNKGPTLAIVRKDNYVFGGFTESSWGGKERCFLCLVLVSIKLSVGDIGFLIIIIIIIIIMRMMMMMMMMTTTTTTMTTRGYRFRL